MPKYSVTQFDNQPICRRDFLKGILFMCGVGLLPVVASCGRKENQDNTAVTSAKPTTAATVTANEVTDISPGTKTARPAGWNETTHGNDGDPNYLMTFPDNKVERMKITITPSDWEAMQANMAQLFGNKNAGLQGGAVPGGDLPVNPPQGGALPGVRIPGGDALPNAGGAAPGGGGGGEFTSENPMWVPATVEYNGNAWTHVGVRYKGNSSLSQGWSNGTKKLPLKLDFDQFEDDYPEIKNQRFYGFKQLSLSNGFSDSTFMRDTISYYILEEAGLVAAKTAHYEVVMDYGQGEVSLGLYVAIEVVDDTVIKRYFGSDDGNIYEGEGNGVSLAQGTFSRISTCFVKENNQEAADWSDVEALYNALHSPLRASDAAAWRQELEAVFDVNVFLEWLAVSAIIQHWDTYGQMTHNFYIYNDPASRRLIWISWDHNMVLGVGGGDPGRDGGAGERSTSLDKKDVTSSWPLIRFLLDDPFYYTRYLDYLAETIKTAFTVDKMAQKCRGLSAVIASYAAQEKGETAFNSAVNQLLSTISQRIQLTTTFLASQGKVV